MDTDRRGAFTKTLAKLTGYFGGRPADLPDSEGRSVELPAPRVSTKTIVIVSVCAVVLVGLFLYLLLGGTAPPTTNTKRDEPLNLLEEARKGVAKETDYNTCRNALDQINIHYGKTPDEDKRLAPEYVAAARESQKVFAFSKDEKEKQEELAELERSSYTLLDAHHLDQCFLFRDVARSLRPSGKPLEQAAAAFRWVVREVRLQESKFPAVPPDFALRRGWGTPLDRALVFVSLLGQLDNVEGRAPRPHLRGCLVGWPAKENEPPQVWACGVLIGDDPNLYLFDPRLGLPLPGPNGEGIATLAEVRTDPDKLLAPLTVQPEYPYDVTAERVREVELYHYVPLSALAPRMRFLQDTVLPRATRATLSVDAAAERKNLDAAAALGDKPVPVKPWPRGTEDLRAFLPRAEGGADRDAAAAPVQAFAMEQVPQNLLPPEFKDPARFPPNIDLGQWVQREFAEPFLRFSLDTKEGAHELMLRGHYDEAIEKIQGERETTTAVIRQARTLEGDPLWWQRVDEWVNKALKKFGDVERAKRGQGNLEAAKQELGEVLKDPIVGQVKTLLQGAAAKRRRPETTYYLALCKHELAELAQARMGPRAGAAPEWDGARHWWNQYTGDYPGEPEIWAARRQHGLVLAAMGRTDEAIQVWKEGEPDDKRPLDKFEKVACLYLAKQAKK
jgi:hypothetical protein